MKEYILYILMRNDLPSMNPGKAMAQASHAANAFMHRCGKAAEPKEWAASTSQGFGTVLVLAGNETQIEEAVIAGKKEGYFSEVIVDPSYPCMVDREIAGLINTGFETAPRVERGDKVVIFRKEATCAYVFGTKEDLKPILGHLPLHP
jgi:peptidyl-tRNA hydrolase